MKCESCQERLLDYTSGTLSAASKREVEEHLAECPVCESEATELRRTWEALGTLPVEEPSSAMQARFYAMLEQAKAEPSASESPAPARSFEQWLLGWWPKRPALQFGLGAMLLMVGLGAGWIVRPTPEPNGEMAALRSEIQTMRQEMTIAMLAHASSVDRLLAISTISPGQPPAGPVLAALIKTADSDPSVNVRLAAVDALSGFIDRRPVREGMYRSLLTQTSPMVQISLIDALASVEDTQALQALQRLIQSSEVDPEVRSHAEMRLERL